MTGWQAGTQSFVPKSCDFVVVAKNPLTLPFRSFDDWHESHDCQGTRWKQAATNQGPWPKNEYKCQISTFVFLLKHECTEWRAERCVLVFQNQGPCAPGTKPFAIRNKNATFRFPKFVSCVGCSDLRVQEFFECTSCVGCSDLRVQEFFECTTKTERCVSRKVVIE